jgi:hypothetical protein
MFYYDQEHVLAHVVSCQLPNIASQFLSQMKSHGAYGWQSSTWKVFSKNFGFPRQFSLHQLLHIH